MIDDIKNETQLRQCTEFDLDYLDMIEEEARWCYEGYNGHKCASANFDGLGTAIGICPILAAIGTRN